MLLPSLSIPVPSYSVAQPVSGAGWAHELKHDGYRLQIHVRDGRVRLYTINGADWSKRYPRIVESAARLQDSAVLEVVCLDLEGVANFDALHRRVNDSAANALAFDLLMVMETIYAANHIVSANRHYESFCDMTVAFSTSNTPKGMGTKCLLQFVSLALRALSQRSSTPRISRVRQRRGSFERGPGQ